ncbi:MAG: hypothetical protein IVW52_10745 [Acidimicrobiales bacterium]|nr:hypothetical protein [Acidimicrobiales bacterium]
MVLHVPGQSVDLVDDDRLDVAVLCDPSEHRSKLEPIGRAGGFALVDVLVDQLPALVADPAPAGLALSGDREAIFGQVLLGLILGRHS